MSPVFRHGSLRLYLLRLLDEEPRHGYEVIRLLRDRFMGVYSPSPGTIYPRLARLEEEGLVTHDEVDGITSALVGLFYLADDYIALGTPAEDYLIVPRSPSINYARLAEILQASGLDKV